MKDREFLKALLNRVTGLEKQSEKNSTIDGITGWTMSGASTAYYAVRQMIELHLEENEDDNSAS